MSQLQVNSNLTKEGAINVLIQAAMKANKLGAFELQESLAIGLAADLLTPKPEAAAMDADGDPIGQDPIKP